MGRRFLAAAFLPPILYLGARPSFLSLKAHGFRPAFSIPDLGFAAKGDIRVLAPWNKWIYPAPDKWPPGRSYRHPKSISWGGCEPIFGIGDQSLQFGVHMGRLQGIGPDTPFWPDAGQRIC